MHHKWTSSILAVLAASTVFFRVAEAGAQLADSDGYVAHDLTLPRGQLRLDTAPSDYGYMDFNPGPGDRTLNNGRGFRVLAWPAAQEVVYFGAGAGLGISDDFEVGALLLPIVMAPGGDFGNMEVYARYRFLDEDIQIGAQATMQIPTNNDFGFGVGLPILWSVRDTMRLDTGFEFEMFTGPFQFNFDLPLAFAFTIADSFFLGPRTGVRGVVRNGPGDGASFPLGLFLGGTIAHKVDLTGAITWPLFLETYGEPDGYAGSAFHGDIVEFTVGVNLYFDVF